LQKDKVPLTMKELASVDIQVSVRMIEIIFLPRAREYPQRT